MRGISRPAFFQHLFCHKGGIGVGDGIVGVQNIQMVGAGDLVDGGGGQYRGWFQIGVGLDIYLVRKSLVFRSYPIVRSSSELMKSPRSFAGRLIRVLLLQFRCRRR